MKVGSYDSYPLSSTVKVSYEVAMVISVSKLGGVVVEFITGSQRGKQSVVMPNTISKLESAIDALAATGDAGEESTLGWDDLETAW